MTDLHGILLNQRSEFGPIFPELFYRSKPHVFDFTSSNAELREAGITRFSPESMDSLTAYVRDKIAENDALIGVGRYNEHRIAYDVPLFTESSESRVVHLGVDLFVPAGTPILAPAAGRVHSFQFNDHPLDYGPTIILEHELGGTVLFSLYGHLSVESIRELAVGQEVAIGQHIASVGDRPTNGDWTPHLHFQLIRDMQDRSGDYPGMSSLAERDIYLELCPDPGPILDLNRRVRPA